MAFLFLLYVRRTPEAGRPPAAGLLYFFIFLFMNIFIVGGGTVGSVTAEYFSKEGHDVTIVEPDPARIRLLNDSLDISVVEGSGTDFSTMKEIGLGKADIFLALTDDDECNIIACSLARSQGARRRLARINDRQFIEPDNVLWLKENGIDDVVNTNESLTRMIQSLVRYPGMTDLQRFLNDKYAVAKFSFSKNSIHYGKRLDDLKFNFPVQKIGYEQVSSFKPYDGTVEINEFLYVYYGCERDRLSDLQRLLAGHIRTIKSVAIFGQGYKSTTAGAELGMALKKEGITTIELITEEDDVALQLSNKYPFSVIVDDPSRPHFAKSGNLQHVDLFLGYSDNFEKNIYACSVASREDVPYTFALVRYPEHTSFVSTIPLTSFLNAAIVTAHQILNEHQPTGIIARSIMEYKHVECVEILVAEDSALVGKPLAQLSFKNSQCISLMRGGDLIPLKEDMKIDEGDRLLLLIVNGEMELLRPLL